MATKTKITGWNPKALVKEVMDNAVPLQTELFVEYAKNKIRLFGDAIQLYNSINHMDRTGNLLNSLCWGVTYNGKMMNSGYYREQSARRSAFLHEFFRKIGTPESVDGHKRAADFLKSHKGRSNGWSVFFAILAPYWGYWESGFQMKFGFDEDENGNVKTTKRRFMQFQVMTHVFDEVSRDLRPAETHLTVYVPKYSYKSPKYRNKKGYEKIGMLR